MSRLVVPSLLVAATLVATICWEAGSVSQSGTSDISGPPTPSKVASATPMPAPPDPVEEWVATSLERPLLRENRRPDKVAGNTKAKGDDTLRLAGVITGQFGDRAIFMVPGVVKPVVAQIGTQLSDFVVRSIEPGRVVVDAAGISRTYRPMSAGKDLRLMVAQK
jgi:hypothetical protein